MVFFEKEDETLQYWKNKVLRTLLRMVVIFGVVAYIPGIIVSYSERLTFIIIIDTLALLLVIFLYFSRSLSYNLKSAILMSGIYLLGLGLLITLGPYGSGFIWLMIVPIITAILLNRKAALLATFIILISVTILGFLIYYGSFDQYLFTEYNLASWITSSVNMIALDLITIYPVTMVISNMKTALIKEKGITSQKEVMVKKLEAHEQNLKRKNQQLKQVNQQLDSFIYRVSHDLRAPLSSIMGLINISRAESDQQQKEYYLALILKSVLKLESFIENLINFSRNWRMKITREPVCFQNMVDSVIEDLKYMETYKNLKVEKEIRENNNFYSDPYRLKIILRNLFSNSIKYSHSNGRKPYLSIKIVVEDEQAVIVVEDNGIGIRQERLPKIFDMFYRAHETCEGSGLGLYIVKEAVQLLKGNIEVESVENQGTKFKINIPTAFSNNT